MRSSSDKDLRPGVLRVLNEPRDADERVLEHRAGHAHVKQTWHEKKQENGNEKPRTTRRNASMPALVLIEGHQRAQVHQAGRQEWPSRQHKKKQEMNRRTHRSG